MTNLRFSNQDAIPQVVSLEVNIEAIPVVVEWYAAYHAGDRFTVTVAGKKQKLDRNGHLAEAL